MNITLKWLYKVVGKKNFYIVALTILQAISGGLGVFNALLFKNWIDSAVKKDFENFRYYITLIIILAVFLVLLGMLVRWLHELATAELENTFKSRLLDKILHKDFASISSIHTAEWLNRLTNDTVVVSSNYVDILPSFAELIVRLFSALTMIIFMDKWFFYIIIPCGLLFVVLTCTFRGFLKKLHRKIQESDGILRIFLQESIVSLIMIKSFGAENKTASEASYRMEQHKAARMKRTRYSNFSSSGFWLAMQAMYWISIAYCATGIMRGTVSYGTLTAIMQLIGQVQGPFANISNYLPRYYAMIASAERLFEAEKFSDEKNIMDLKTVREFYDKKFSSLVLDKVYFSYKSHENNEKNIRVLNGLSFEIKKGDYIAFTGYSGCGKSTVLKILMCMYHIDAGEIFLISHNEKENLTSSWRKLFAYVPQGNILIKGTIREIISFARPEFSNDTEKLQAVLKVACADEFVHDIDMPLGERGGGLSEGQMQRLAIARAIFSECPVLLLDEATSALDEKTEMKLIHNLRALTDRTVIIITHRMEVLSICNRVIDLSK